MSQSYFIWNGTDCRSKGIIMRGPASIIRPEERVTHKEIPGRSGDMTALEGNNVFNSYIQTVTISVRGGYGVREAYKWLRGDGYVTFSGEPDRKQAARIIGAITLDRVSRNLDNWAGEVQFYCQPLKERIHTEPTETITESGSTIINGGDVASEPLWQVRFGSSSNMGTLRVVGNGVDDTIELEGFSAGGSYLIDSQVMEVTSTNRRTSYTKKSLGPFPRLAPGENTITFEGLDRIIITKRERFL